ncbi:type III PLP-dependent enzyme [Actinomycetospora sp.]|jgi:diaminopimelate decarboxylase|uniref:type III PLP-dependent enzyme n=1 Tax=Actinomycetospora sp. TaxID=1872135 RepID=UPI002F3E8526
MDAELLAVVRDRVAGPEPVCLFAYDLAGLRRHVERTVAALPARCAMYYAMKANSAAPILTCLAPLVAGFEVASGGEIQKVRAVSPDAPILVGGPAKTPSELDLALKAGVTRIHAESLLELHRISEAATAADVTAEVALRVNLAGPFPDATLAMAGRPTQFGISEDDLPAAIEAATTLPGLRFAGFHLHSLSNNLSAATHLAMLGLYRDTVAGWERRFGVRVEVLDVGGGIGVDYGRPETPFDWDGFCAGLAEWVATLPEHWREIQFECGRYLTAACGRYVVEVLDVKANHGVPYALVRGGTHHFRLPVSWQHSHPFTVLPVERWDSAAPRPEIRDAAVTVTGELCTPKDVLARDVPVSLLRAGDVLVFEQAGAYGWDISHHDFLSHPHPEHVFLDGG